MAQILTQKKDNYLLFTGVILFICAFISYSLIENYTPEKLPASEKFGDFENVFIIFIFAVIIAPLIEEIVFRGFFLQKKIYEWLFYVGSISFILITEAYYTIIILLIIGLLSFVFKVKKNLKIIYFLNALLFALIHYKFTHFTNIYSIVPMFFQFSGGLILIWIVINYNLFKSMLLHFCINFFAIGSLLIALKFPDDVRTYSIKDKDVVIIYNKIPLQNDKSITISKGNLEANNFTIRSLAKNLKISAINYSINDSLRYYRYQFKIEHKNGLNINPKDAENILRKAKLIE